MYIQEIHICTRRNSFSRRSNSTSIYLARPPAPCSLEMKRPPRKVYRHYAAATAKIGVPLSLSLQQFTIFQISLHGNLHLIIPWTFLWVKIRETDQQGQLCKIQRPDSFWRCHAPHCHLLSSKSFQEVVEHRNFVHTKIFLRSKIDHRFSKKDQLEKIH